MTTNANSTLIYVLGNPRPVDIMRGVTRNIINIDDFRDTSFSTSFDRKFEMVQNDLMSAILGSCGGQKLAGMRGFDRFIMRIATQLEFGWTSTSPVDLYFRLLYTKHMELTAGDSGTRAPFCGYAIHGLESLL